MLKGHLDRAIRKATLAAVMQNGRALKFAPSAMKNDAEVVLAAMAQDITALSFAVELTDDQDFMMMAVARRGTAFLYASRRLKSDKAVVLSAVAQDPCALGLASPELQVDKEVLDAVKASMRSEGTLLAEAQLVRAGGRLVAAQQRLAFAACFTHGLALRGLGPPPASMASVAAAAATSAADELGILPEQVLFDVDLGGTLRARGAALLQMPSLQVIQHACRQGWHWRASQERAAARTALGRAPELGFAATLPARPTAPAPPAVTSAITDAEILAKFSGPGSLGLKLAAVEGQVQLLAVNPGTQAERHPQLRPGLVLTTVAGQSVRGLSYTDVLGMVKCASRPLTLGFTRVDSQGAVPAAATEAALGGAVRGAAHDGSVPAWLPMFSPGCPRRLGPSLMGTWGGPSSMPKKMTVEAGEHEARVVDALCQPWGARPAPPKDVLAQFVVVSRSLDAYLVCALLEEKLEDENWRVVLRSLAGIEALVKAKKDGVVEYFDGNDEFIQEIAVDPESQKALKTSAEKCLMAFAGAKPDSFADAGMSGMLGGTATMGDSAPAAAGAFGAAAAPALAMDVAGG
jgi:hypothetical protein